MSLQLQPGALYAMPANFGPLVSGPTVYQDVSSVVVGYRTDRASLEALLPDVFDLPEPLVLVTASTNRGVEWLAGGSYNLVAINIPVTFRGDQGDVAGYYALVVWENRTAPILPGRERTGIAKIAAEIPELRQVKNRWYGSMSSEGATFFELEFEEGGHEAPTPAGVSLADGEDWGEPLNWFGWRYIPDVNGTGGSINEFVNFPQETRNFRVAGGAASLRWTALKWRQAPADVHIIRKIASLPIEAYAFAYFTQAANRLRSDLAHVMRPRDVTRIGVGVA